MAHDFFKQFINTEDSSWTFIIDEDDKVCYGYLLFEKNPISDVWLFNNVTVDDSDWLSEENLPFGIPNQYLSKKYIDSIPIEPALFKIEWKKTNNSVTVEILYDNEFVASVSNHIPYGYSTFVTEDTPVIRRLDPSGTGV